MVEIKVGAELDRAVAGAIGLEVHGDEFCLIQAHQWDKLFGRSDTDTVMDMPFMPSSHLDAAFAAAERVGLFDVERDGPEVHLAKTFDGQWEILTGGSAMGYVSREATPALAICAGILALAK